MSIPVTYCVSRLNPYALLVLPLISKFNFIYLWTILFGWFSNYHPIHLTVLTMVLYLLVNIFNLHNQMGGDDELPIKKFDIDLIHSYWPENKRRIITNNKKKNYHNSEPNILHHSHIFD